MVNRIICKQYSRIKLLILFFYNLKIDKSKKKSLSMQDVYFSSSLNLQVLPHVYNYMIANFIQVEKTVKMTNFNFIQRIQP